MKVLVGLGIALAIIVVIAAAAGFWVVNAVTRERVSEVTTLNAGGATGRALLVYHPGLSEFQDRIVAAFTDGLVQAGWEVDQTTASEQAPADPSGYDLVVVGSPIYGGTVAKPLADYVARLGDFLGKPVVILLTGAGAVPEALTVTEAMVAAANGSVAQRLAYTTMQPNESERPYSGSNVDKALQMARDAALELTLEPGV
jgi:Tfp pilus assembly major pilin PilA